MTIFRMMSKKVASDIIAIKRVRNSFSREILLTIYRAPVQPHFNYCSAVWGTVIKASPRTSLLGRPKTPLPFSLPPYPLSMPATQAIQN